jgi:16S rRNA processing protein RimM
MLRSFTDSPKTILSYTPLTDKTGTRQFSLICDGVKGDDLIVRVEGITDRNAAELLKRTELFAPASALPPKEEDSWYHSELVGMQGFTADGKAYGRVITVHNYGAGDILEFEFEDGSTEMLPFKKEFIGTVDEAQKRIEVFPPEYLDEK